MKTLMRKIVSRLWAKKTYVTHYKHWDRARLIRRFYEPTRVEREEHRRLCQVRTENFVRVDQPMVLISQASRSGGTVLSQLFDMHPQCHAHPSELRFGMRTASPELGMTAKQPHDQTVDLRLGMGTVWPELNVNDGPEAWFRELFEPTVVRYLTEGYSKGGKQVDQRDVLPWLLLPSLQKEIFDACVAASRPRSQRQILDCFMTSYFNAWLDNQNLHSGPKKYVTLFASKMLLRPASIDAFFLDYPDGKLISIIRDPKGWYVSARSHQEDLYGGERGIENWIASAQAMVRNKQKYGSAVAIVCFEDLLTDTEATMRSIADFLGIDFTPSMLTPTFNGLPIRANSHFKVAGHGINKEPLSRCQQELSAEEITAIDRQTSELHQHVLRLCLPKGRAAAEVK